MSILFADIINEETYETEESGDIVVCDNEGCNCTFNDLYITLQQMDSINAYLYAESYFNHEAINNKKSPIEVLNFKNPTDILNFLLEAHKRIAKHLLMTSLDNNNAESGKFTTTQSYICDEQGSFHPTEISPKDIPEAFGKFCGELFAKIQGIKNPADAYRVAAFALVEMGKIHPFSNGNGRLGRLLMNCILFSAQCSVMNFEDKKKYYSLFVECVKSKDSAPMAKEIVTLSLRKPKAEERAAIESLAKAQMPLNETGFRLVINNATLGFANFEKNKWFFLEKQAFKNMGIDNLPEKMFFTRFDPDVYKEDCLKEKAKKSIK